MTASASDERAQAARALSARLAGPRLVGCQGPAAAVTLDRFLVAVLRAALFILAAAAGVVFGSFLATLGGC